MEGRPTELTVRLATAADVPLLAPIERAAGERFRAVGMGAVADDEPPPAPLFEEAVRRGHLWVAELDDGVGGPAVVGYVWALELDGQHHLEQISVLPEAGGQGVGVALVEAVVAWARAAGGTSVTLSTFATVPWNGPWYEQLGFSVVPDPEGDPRWRRLRDHERAAGLDVDARVVMRRTL